MCNERDEEEIIEDEHHADGEEYLEEGEGEILMGRWDCDSCDTKGLMGDKYDCENCGSPRPEDVKFYLPDPENAQVVTDDAGIKAAEAGSDWQCEYCDSWMAAVDKDCTNCGGGEEKGAVKQKTETYVDLDLAPVNAEGKTHRAAKKEGGSHKDWQCAYCDSKMTAQDQSCTSCGGQDAKGREELVALTKAGRDKPANKSGCTAKFVLGLLLLVMGSCFFCSISSSLLSSLPSAPRANPPKEMTVTEHSWTLTKKVEEYRSFNEGNWTKPSSAYEVSSSNKFHHNDQVIDRYETHYRTETYEVRDGYNTESYTERVNSGSKRVKSGYAVKNLGNGRFKKIPKYKNVPIYKNVRKTRRIPRYRTKSRRIAEKHPVYKKVTVFKTYHKYKINRWRALTPLSQTGLGKSPQWPAFEEGPARNGGPQLGDKRVGDTTELYSMTIKDKDGHVYKTRLNKTRWASFHVGQKIQVVLRAGHIESLRPIQVTKPAGSSR
jgi:hypothetical protein